MQMHSNRTKSFTKIKHTQLCGLKGSAFLVPLWLNETRFFSTVRKNVGKTIYEKKNWYAERFWGNTCHSDRFFRQQGTWKEVIVLNGRVHKPLATITKPLGVPQYYVLSPSVLNELLSTGFTLPHSALIPAFDLTCRLDQCYLDNGLGKGSACHLNIPLFTTKYQSYLHTVFAVI